MSAQARIARPIRLHADTHLQRIRTLAGVGLLVLPTFAAGCLTSLPLSPGPADANTLTLLPVAAGFTAPVDLQAPNDASGRLFVLDQVGVIWVVTADGQVLSTPLLDLRSKVSASDERGLLGLALHPHFATNGRFFVYYNTALSADAPAGAATEVTLSEFGIADGTPNEASLSSERELLRVAKPQTNHNGGQLAFGSDGYLYIGMGDGGGVGDSGFGHTAGLGNAQDTSNLLGKILRINVDIGDPYSIPLDNPFVNVSTAQPEIYAYGFRNPWRFSFDPVPGGTTRLFVADVGQALVEEINLVVRGGNYGWNIREGLLCFNPLAPAVPPATCADRGADGSVLQPPIIEYQHTDATGASFGLAVIGGYLYRGTAVPNLQGSYVFGDYSAVSGFGKIFVASQATSGTWSFKEVQIAGTTDGRLGRFVLAFGRDAAGELYVLTSATAGPSGTTGVVYKIIGFD